MDDDRQPVTQNVTAVNGFAYGVIGADIHVFGDNVPLYLLRKWEPPQEADLHWLRRIPSRLLNARFAIVGFTGRADELANLHRWRDSPPRLSARWLYGPGGQGKTRLARQLAEESLEAGWLVVTAVQGPGQVQLAPGSQDLRADGVAGLLLIIDYADQWPLTHLTWLFSNALLHRGDVRARVLLLARSADAWPAVRAALTEVRGETSTQLLGDLPGGLGPRGEMFRAARDGFAARYGLADPNAVGPPGPLDDPAFGLTLALHMAALVAVDAHVNGATSPSDLTGLTVYLLNREHLQWARLRGDAAHDLDPAGRAYQTPSEVMNRLVFTAVLTGPLPAPAGAALVRSMRVPLPAERALADHSLCYPPADPARPTVLEPLAPDRLAEDFLALTMPGHTADYPAQPWAASTTGFLLARDSEREPPDWTPRAITFLAEARPTLAAPRRPPPVPPAAPRSPAGHGRGQRRLDRPGRPRPPRPRTAGGHRVLLPRPPKHRPGRRHRRARRATGRASAGRPHRRRWTCPRPQHPGQAPGPRGPPRPGSGGEPAGHRDLAPARQEQALRPPAQSGCLGERPGGPAG
ncbi:hypothetical protein [Nonomuraea sp. NPDC001699]